MSAMFGSHYGSSSALEKLKSIRASGGIRGWPQLRSKAMRALGEGGREILRAANYFPRFDGPKNIVEADEYIAAQGVFENARGTILQFKERTGDEKVDKRNVGSHYAPIGLVHYRDLAIQSQAQRAATGRGFEDGHRAITAAGGATSPSGGPTGGSTRSGGGGGGEAGIGRTYPGLPLSASLSRNPASSGLSRQLRTQARIGELTTRTGGRLNFQSGGAIGLGRNDNAHGPGHLDALVREQNSRGQPHEGPGSEGYFTNLAANRLCDLTDANRAELRRGVMNAAGVLGADSPAALDRVAPHVVTDVMRLFNLNDEVARAGIRWAMEGSAEPSASAATADAGRAPATVMAGNPEEYLQFHQLAANRSGT